MGSIIIDFSPLVISIFSDSRNILYFLMPRLINVERFINHLFLVFIEIGASPVRLEMPHLN
jgi:hypothetical protein